MTPPLKFMVTFRASTGSQVTVLRGDGPPKITSGEGGWDVISRPRRVALTQWTGHDPYRMDIPILFDGWHDRSSVEESISRLNAMAMGHDFEPPPTLHVDGAVPVKGATWVIEAIDWGDEVYWDLSAQGRYFRMRQDAIVHLLQYQAEQRLNIIMPKTLPNEFIVPRDGFTLRDVAKAMYGNAKNWKKILRANPDIRDPNKLKAQQTIRVP